MGEPFTSPANIKSESFRPSQAHLKFCLFQGRFLVSYQPYILSLIFLDRFGEEILCEVYEMFFTALTRLHILTQYLSQLTSLYNPRV